MSSEKRYVQAVADQYRDSSNLNARSRLHDLYSTNPRGWFQWYFDHLDLPAGSCILELGCGPAGLWRATLDRIPASWRLTLTDFSEGMVTEARQHLAGRAGQPGEQGGQFQFEVVNAENIPYPNESFDAVIANHMLYHVPNRARAIAEIRRVLVRGGRLFAATNGAKHMLELFAMVARLAADLPDDPIATRPGSWSSPFSLENGAEQLAQSFAVVRLERYPDTLKVTEAQPLVDYVLSMLSMSQFSAQAQKIEAFKREIERQIERQGAVHITKDSGILIAS